MDSTAFAKSLNVVPLSDGEIFLNRGRVQQLDHATN